MKTLIVVAHPNLEKSKINKRRIEELDRYPEKYIVHHLHNAFLDWNIDLEYQYQLLESVNKVVLQFPFFWFNCLPLLKKNGLMMYLVMDGHMGKKWKQARREKNISGCIGSYQSEVKPKSYLE